MSVIQLTDRQREIKNLIETDPYISINRMSVIMSVNKRTIERELANMQSKNIIRHEGSTRTGKWKIL